MTDQVAREAATSAQKSFSCRCDLPGPKAQRSQERNFNLAQAPHLMSLSGVDDGNEVQGCLSLSK